MDNPPADTKCKIQMLGTPHIDLFATRLNKFLPVFVSPIPDTLAESLDSLMLDWMGLDAYAFPPPALLGVVLRKIELESAIVNLLAPNWPAIRGSHCCCLY